MAKTWTEVKSVLDDPSVPADTKSVLISSWMRENPPPPPFLADQEPDDIKQKREEAEKLATAYNANPFFAGVPLDEAYDKAKQAGDQASYNEDQEKKAVDDGKKKLDDTKPPASDESGSAGSTGTKTSDELFDAAAPALKLFETFGSLLAKIPDDCRGNTRALDLDKDIRKPFDEQRGISFQNFVEDAAHFKTGSTTVDKTVENTGTELSSLYQSWTGAGADASSDTYNDKIQPKANKLSQTLGNAGEATLSTATTVFQLCKGKADAVIGMYTDLVGKADYTMAQKVVAVASGEHGNEQDLAQIAGWMDANFGTNLVKTLNDQGCCDGDEIKKHGQDLAKQWIQNQFNPDMWDRLYQGFAKTCKDTKDLVDQAYDELDKVMGKVKNEFEGVTMPGGSGTGAPGGPGSGTGSGSGGSGGGSGSGSGGSGDGSGSGSGGSGGGDGSGAGGSGSGGSGSGSGSGSGGSGSGGGGSVPPIPDSDTPSGAPGGGSGSGSGSGSGGGGSMPSIPDVSGGSGSGSGGGSGSGSGGGGSMPSIPDTSGGGGSGGGDDTTPSSSTPPPSSSDGQEAAAAAAEAAKKKAADALSQFSGEGIKTDSGDGAGLGGSGSGSGGGLGDDTSPSGSGSGSAGGQDAAAAAAEAAKKKAADALSQFSGEGIKTDSGDGAGLGGSGGGSGLGDAAGSGSGSGSDPAADGKEAAEKAADDAKKQASDALDKLGGDGIKTDQDGDGLLDDKTDGDKADGDLDHLKVKQGDKTFEMTEPDHDGKMDIKVGEGDGPAKDFKLDWPDGDAAKTDLGVSGTDDPGKPDADGVYHPGADGKIHIQDGDLKITAERPDGADGPTVVTVDDGTGKPTTYTLGEDDTSPGGLDDDTKKHLDDALSGETRGDTASHALGDTPDAKPDDLPKHSGTLDGIGASGGGGGGAHALSTAGLDAGGGVTGSLGETPSLSEGVHSGVGATQQPAAAGFAPAAAAVGANGQAGQSMGGGMPMGGMGGGGQGGGDQERSNRAYRIEGAVFEPMAEPTGRIVGSLDDEEPPAPRRW